MPETMIESICRKDREDTTTLSLTAQSLILSHREDAIRLIAYDLWRKDGKTEGEDLRFWFKAERVWNRLMIDRLWVLQIKNQ